jgi:hypothetical protein
MGPEVIVPVAFFLSVPVTVIGIMMARAYSKRIDRGMVQRGGDPEVVQRLERMEQAIDAISVEVERISEGQRFVTRLLSEKAQTTALGAPAESEQGRLR